MEIRVETLNITQPAEIFRQAGWGARARVVLMEVESARRAIFLWRMTAGVSLVGTERAGTLACCRSAATVRLGTLTMGPLSRVW